MEGDALLLLDDIAADVLALDDCWGYMMVSASQLLDI